jgi:hypothetical protein
VVAAQATAAGFEDVEAAWRQMERLQRSAWAAGVLLEGGRTGVWVPGWEGQEGWQLWSESDVDEFFAAHGGEGVV